MLRHSHSVRRRNQQPFALNLWLPYQDSDNPQLSDAAVADHRALLAPCFKELGSALAEKPPQLLPRYDQQIGVLLAAAHH